MALKVNKGVETGLFAKFNLKVRYHRKSRCNK